MSGITVTLIVVGAFLALLLLTVLVLALLPRNWIDRGPPQRNEAVVDVPSGTLVAFDVSGMEGVRYRLPQPGRYRIPLDAVRRIATEEGEHVPGGMIGVDTATILLVDAQFEAKLQKIEERLSEEIKACPSVPYRYDAAVEELGIKFDYLSLDGDGNYVLDLARIERLEDSW